MIAVGLENILAIIALSQQNCCELAFKDDFFKLFAIGLDMSKLKAAFVTFCLRVSYKQYGQVVPQRISHIDHFPYASGKISPFIIPFFLAPALFIAVHDVVYCVNNNRLYFGALFGDCQNVSRYFSRIINAQVIFILSVILLPPALP